DAAGRRNGDGDGPDGDVEHRLGDGERGSVCGGAQLELQERLVGLERDRLGGRVGEREADPVLAVGGGREDCAAGDRRVHRGGLAWVCGRGGVRLAGREETEAETEAETDAEARDNGKATTRRGHLLAFFTFHDPST